MHVNDPTLADLLTENIAGLLAAGALRLKAASAGAASFRCEETLEIGWSPKIDRNAINFTFTVKFVLRLDG